jgi:hypothetical protein
MEDHAAGVFGLPVAHALTFVGVEVVENHVDDLVFGNVVVKVVEKRDEDRLGTIGGNDSQHLAGLDFEAGGQAAGSVADVLGLSVDELAGLAQGQVGESTLKRLDGSLLVDPPNRAIVGGLR